MESLVKRVLLTLFILTSFSLSGQQPALRHYSVDQGLPSSEVYHILQDSKGYIWLATNMGVSRFDGRNFKNYDIQDGLTENTVFEVYEDHKGRIWFVSFPFQLSYFQNDEIHPYRYNSLLEKISGHGLVPVKCSFGIDTKDNIFFSFLNDGKIYKIDGSGLLSIAKIVKTAPSVVIEEIDNNILSAQTGVRSAKDFIINVNTRKNRSNVRLDMSDNKYSGGYYIIDETKNGDILFAQNELMSIIKSDGKFETYDFKDRVLWVSSEDEDNIWIGKEFSGVSKYNFRNLEYGPIESYLNGIAVTSVLIDKEKGVWFSTIGSGIFYLPSKAFLSYDLSDGLSGKNIKTVTTFKNRIYLGFEDSYLLDIIENSVVTTPRELEKFKNKIKVLTTFKSKILWLGTEKYLHSFDGKKYIKIVNNHNQFISQDSKNLAFSIKDIYPVSESQVMIAQMRSLAIVKNGKVVYDSYVDDKIALRIESIEKETDSSFLLGTFNGLWRLTGTKFEHLGNSVKLLGERITDIVSLPNNKGYILATKGSGLVVNINDSIYQINQANGLSSNSVTSLLINGDELWAATNNGLNLLSLRHLLNRYKPEIIVFKKEHGLISNEINQIKGYKQFIYIATTEGLTVFDRTKYHPSKFPPPIYIEGVRVLKRDTVVSKTYNLKYNQNFITISYGGINFRDAGNLHYKYRLIGLNQGWVTTKNLQVEYAFLPSGKYKFEVYAINSEGLISSLPAVVNLIIYPPFWKTWWFLSLMAIIAILLTLAYISYRTRQLRIKHLLQNDISKYKQQALIRQMDPHFVFNTLNSIQAFVMRNDSIASTVYLSKFSRLMRLILNNSQKQEVLLADEIDALNLYMELESMRFKEKFEYCIDCDPDLETELINIPAFIVQPLVENAIWHGILRLDKQGSIKVNFLKDGEHLICTVEDNGIGRIKSQSFKSEQEKMNRSIGISIVETRLNLLSSYYGLKLKINFEDLYSKNHEPSGTRVSLNLPIIK
jgi:ligand-binding sensor domain-containing protein